MRLKTFVLVLFVSGCGVTKNRTPFLHKKSPLAFQYSSEEFKKGNILTNVHFSQSVKSIEPTTPTGLAGFGGALRRLPLPYLPGIGNDFTFFDPYTSVDLAPRVKLLLWEGRDAQGLLQNFILVSTDLVAVTADMTQKLIKFLRSKHPGIELSQSNFQLVATHTHSGPGGLSENPFWGVFASDRFSPSYYSFFESRVSEALLEAQLTLSPLTQIRLSQGVLEGFNKSRTEGEYVDNRQTQYNFHTSMLTGCLEVFAVHPTWFSQSKLILSSDIPGHIEKAMGSKNCIFFNGAVGNAESKNNENLQEYARRFELNVNDEVLYSRRDVATALKYGSTVIEVGHPAANLEACALKYLKHFVHNGLFDYLPSRTKISYLLLDKGLFLFVPGEPVGAVQKQMEARVKDRFPEIEFVQMLGLSNDYLGYIVESKNYSHQNLESCSTLYGSHIANKLQDGFMKLLESEL